MPVAPPDCANAALVVKSQPPRTQRATDPDIYKMRMHSTLSMPLEKMKYAPFPSDITTKTLFKHQNTISITFLTQVINIVEFMICGAYQEDG